MTLSAPSAITSRARSVAATRRSWRSAAAAAVAVAALAASATPATSAAAVSDDDSCLRATTATFTATSTFGPGGATLAWAVRPGCASVTVALDGQAVPASGTRSVSPAAGTRYTLSATSGSKSRGLVTQTVVVGTVIGYGVTPYRGGYIVNRVEEDYGAAAPLVDEQAQAMIDSLVNGARGGLVGKVLEIHVIPTYVPLTRLPAFRHLAGTRTDDGRLWADVRGSGGTLLPGTNRVAASIGEEEMYDAPGPLKKAYHEYGYVLAHELGHAVHLFAATSYSSYVTARFEERTAAGGPWIGHRNSDADVFDGEDYTRSSAEEYWAEGSAALFGYSRDSRVYPEYEPTWLQANDPALYQLLDSVYRLR